VVVQELRRGDGGRVEHHHRQRGGGPRHDQTIEVNNKIIFVVGLPVPAVETQVYEVFQLTNLEHTLRVLLLYMGAGRS